MILGMLWLTVLWKTYAALGKALSRSLCQMEIEKNWLNTSNRCDSFQVAGTSITLVGRIKLTIIATSYGLKKTPEKNGAT
jgi:hypothetical protein